MGEGGRCRWRRVAGIHIADQVVVSRDPDLGLPTLTDLGRRGEVMTHPS